MNIQVPVFDKIMCFYLQVLLEVAGVSQPLQWQPALNNEKLMNTNCKPSKPSLQ